MKTILKISLVSLLIVVAGACTTQRTVKRISPDQQVDLSGRWNDTDSKLVAEDITNQVLGQKWIADFMNTHSGNKPIVIVGLVKNKSHEHISDETFVKDIEKAIIKNGSVRLVQGGEKRTEIRGERADQQEFASPETVKKWGKELGADFIMQGTINSIVDSYNKEQITFYQVDMELTNLETNEVVWMGDKKIKKYIAD